jgi:hypothetical protein
MARKPMPPAREKTVQVGLRLPVSLVEDIDLYAERLGKETGLLGVTRTDAATVLLTKGVEAVGKGSKKR